MNRTMVFAEQERTIDLAVAVIADRTCTTYGKATDVCLIAVVRMSIYLFTVQTEFMLLTPVSFLIDAL